MYRIKNSQGLYWVGHSYNCFNETGKVWKKLNHARCAVTNTSGHTHIPNWLADCVIVKYELVEIGIFPIRG